RAIRFVFWGLIRMGIWFCWVLELFDAMPIGALGSRAKGEIGALSPPPRPSPRGGGRKNGGWEGTRSLKTGEVAGEGVFGTGWFGRFRLGLAGLAGEIGVVFFEPAQRFSSNAATKKADL